MNITKALNDHMMSAKRDNSAAPYAYLTGFYMSMIETLYKMGDIEIKEYIEYLLEVKE